MADQQIIFRSSSADIYVDRATGDVIKRDYEAMGGTTEWDDVAKFDPSTFPEGEDETDVLLVGFWTTAGVYVAPEPLLAEAD